MTKATPDSDLQKGISLPATLALVFLIGSTAFAIDGSLVALPTIAAYFEVSEGASQRTVSLYLLGLALGQIPMGLLADRFGRRPVVLGAMTLFVVFGVATSICNSVEALVTARFLQGFFGAAGTALSRAIARDLTSGETSIRLMSLLAATIGLTMVIAPLFGGVLLHFFGWRMTFGASAAFGGLGLLFSLFFVPESRPLDHGVSVFTKLVGGLSAFFTNRRAIFGSVLVGVTFAVLIAFVTLSADILINERGISEFGYALSFSTISIGYMSGGLLCRRFALRFPSYRMTGYTAAIFVLCSAVLALGAMIDLPTAAIIGLFAVFFAAIGAMLPLATVAVLADLPNNAGIAAALLGTIQLAIGGSYSLVLTMLGVTTLKKLTFVLAATGTVVSVIAFAKLFSLSRAVRPST